MIRYGGQLWGFGLLFRTHGSAVAKAIPPSLLSTMFFFMMYYSTGIKLENQLEWRVTAHPYPIGALVAAFAFLLVFRANYSYARYWDACTSVHQMLSKWQDVGMQAASFHYQSELYSKIRPPAFGDHPEIGAGVLLERERQQREMSISKLEAKMEEEDGPSIMTRIRKVFGIKFAKKKKKMAWSKRTKKNINASFRRTSSTRYAMLHIPRRHSVKTITLNGDVDGIVNENGTTFNTDNGPSVFLQELCHLLSLLSAVALSTLRNDRDLGQSPLVEYQPGDTMPPEDPDDLPDEIRSEYNEGNFLYTYFMYVVGITRTKRHQTLYNAVRPFGVLGGVSDAEVELLKACAGGASAKVALVSLWVYEYIIREQMHGSMGNVAPPIISRLHQFTSDGILGYNEARKVAMVPFPFPHAQICIVFIAVLSVLFPTLYLSYCEYLWYGALLNFFTMLCFTGLHEVSRELENPFQNTPNDLPLPTFQAQFNEMLVTMYSGFHPDFYWTLPTVPTTPVQQHPLENGIINNQESTASSSSTPLEGNLLNIPPTIKENLNMSSKSMSSSQSSSSDIGYGSLNVVTHS